jgi:3-hydroxy acid dehydrogenase / malonic semialdehyde reductase
MASRDAEVSFEGRRRETSLDGATALVTGASSGIGRATAESFAAAGARLVLVARRADRLAELARELELRYATVSRCIPLDVRDRTQVVGALGALGADWRDVDVLVNAAGLAAGRAMFQDSDPEDWDRMLDTNVSGVLSVTHTLLPRMIERGTGHVVNIGSLAGRAAYPQGAVYCATKAALDRITTGLRMDLLGTGVRVSTVDPGLVETEFSVVRFGGDQERAADVYRGLTPLTAEDVADAVRWVVERPRNMVVADMLLMPIAQAGSTAVHRTPDVSA